jgi:hypothetical protein
MRLTTFLLFLATFPPVTIFARPWNTSDECPTEIITFVTEDPCDRSYCSPDPQFTTMHSVHDALRTCPNITVLDLRVKGMGCSSFPSRWNFPFDPAGSDTYPRLKTLRLDGYDFWSELPGEREPWLLSSCWYGGYLECTMDHLYWLYQGNWMSWIKWRMLSKEQRGKSNGQLWVDAMDWSGIEEMAIEGFVPQSLRNTPVEGIVPASLRKTAKNFTSLRTLESTDWEFIELLPEHTLTNLSWVGYIEGNDLVVPLQSQGKSLKSLEYRSPEIAGGPFNTGFEPSMLARFTTQLKHLSMNIGRNGTWPWEDLEQIAAVPTVRSADLWMGIQSDCRKQYNDGDRYHRMYEEEYGKDWCKGEDQFQKPYLDDDTALEIFNYMREKKKGEELKQVTFWVGDWMREYGGPAYEPPWLEGRRGKVVCKADADVELEDWCVIEEGKEYWKDPFPRWMDPDFYGEPWADEVVEPEEPEQWVDQPDL